MDMSDWEVQGGTAPNSEVWYKDFTCIDGRVRCVAVGNAYVKLNNCCFDDLYYDHAQGYMKSWYFYNSKEHKKVSSVIRKYLSKEDIELVIKVHSERCKRFLGNES